MADLMGGGRRPPRDKNSLRRQVTKKALGRIYEDIEDTVVPRTEDFIFDLFSSIISGLSNLVIGAFEGLVYRDESGRSETPSGKRHGGPSYRDYYDRKKRRQNMSRSDHRRDDDRRPASKFTDGLVSCRNYDEILYSNRETASRLVRQIKDDANAHNGITVSELYEYLQKTGGDFTDTYWGWRNLDSARVQAVGSGRYWVRLPEPEELN